MDERKLIKERVQKVGLPYRVWAQLASTPESKVYATHVSNFFDGYSMSEDKTKRLMAVLETVEALCAADELRLDLSDVQNVRLALKRLAEHKAAAAEVATEVADEDDGDVAGADAILAGSSGVQR